MPGFVRAVAIDERSLLGASPRNVTPEVDILDEARRDGLRMILLSSHSLDELHARDDLLLAHFDGVVAESGAVVQVGAGPSRRVALPPRGALVEVLDALDVDPHDTLAVAGPGADTEMLGALEVAVGDGIAGRGLSALRRIVDDLRAGLPEISPSRHDVTVPLPGRGGVQVPGAHANVVVCAASPGAADLPGQLVGRWADAGYSTVVLDLAGRHREGRIVDAAHSSWPDEFSRALRVRRGRVVVSSAGIEGSVEPGAGSHVLSLALAAVRRRRARSGRPHWLVIDAAEPVLADPDLPPEALDLTASGHCLVLREHRGRPPVPLGDVVRIPCGPGCTLAE